MRWREPISPRTSGVLKFCGRIRSPSSRCAIRIFLTYARSSNASIKLESASTQATSAALRVLLGLPHALAGRLGELRAPTPEQVTLVLTDGRTVLWGGPVDGPTKASAVLALLHLPGTVFDVSAPGVATRR